MKEEARKIVNRYLEVSAGYALATSLIPGTTVGVVAVEAHMVYGYNLSPTEATSTVGALLGAGTVIKTTLNEALTFIPGVGYIVKQL